MTEPKMKRIEIPLDRHNADGTPRVIVVEVPDDGEPLTVVEVNALYEAVKRSIERRGAC